jgi:hypothetical protein
MAAQYSDPYEDWKAQGRPGGSFDAWQASQGGGGDAPPADVSGGSPSAAQPTPGGAPGYDDLKAWQAWYGQQQGGNRPEDMERFLQPETLKRWDPYLIKEGPDAGKYRSMRGAPGVFDKPTECPPGSMPGGGDETSGCVPNGQAQGSGVGGGSGGGSGTGGDGAMGSGWDQGLTALYKQALTDPKAAQALVMMGGGAQFGQDLDTMQKQIDMMEEGPAKEAMKAKLVEQRTTGKMGLRQAGAQVGLQGLTGLVPLHQDFEKFSRGLSENARQFDEGLSWDRDKFGQTLGWDKDKFGQSLSWDKDQFGQTMGYNKWAKQGDWDMMKWQTKESKPGFWGSFGSILGGLGSSAIQKWSDVNLKENIAPGRRGLTDLRKVVTKSYNYKKELDPTLHPTEGVIAQDLEKFAPEFVIDTPSGFKAVDTYGLLSMTMRAVQELDKKVSKKEKK